MATIKEINHDSSTNINNHYGSVTDPDGAISVAAGAALDSSTYGVDCDFDAGVNTVQLVETFAFSSNELRWRIIIKMDNLSSSGIDAIADFLLEDNAGGDEFVILVDATAAASTYHVSAVKYNRDIGGLATLVSNVSIPSTGEVCLEIRAIRETNSTSADGEVEFFVNGVSEASISNVENFTQFAQIAQTRIKFLIGNANISGNIFYDQWLLDNDNTTALCAISNLLTLSIIPKPCSIDASGEFIYVALLNNGTPILSKISTALDGDGTTVFDPGAGDVIGVECGRYNADVVWIAGLFDGTNQVEKSEDGGSSFVVKDSGFNAGGVFAFDIGPDSDEKVIVNNNDTQTLETVDDGETWTVTTTTNIEALSIDRLTENTQETVFGNYGDVNNSINYSINSGTDIEDYQTGVFPNENVTGVIVN